MFNIVNFPFYSLFSSHTKVISDSFMLPKESLDLHGFQSINSAGVINKLWLHLFLSMFSVKIPS